MTKVSKKKTKQKEQSSIPSTETANLRKRGYKHLIECRCVLPQFKSKKDPPRHKFIVFSVADENDVIQQKYAQCNNCGLIHRVVDLCKSEIQSGKENASSILTIEDIKISLPKDLAVILEKYRVELPSWEYAAFIIENKEWGNFIVLEQEEDSGTKHGKYVRILGENFYKVENFSRQEFF